MSDLKKCPVCGTEMDASLDQCPVCGLKGLHQFFPSLEHRQDWVRNVVEPHKLWYEAHSEKALATPCRVFAGQNYALYLTKGGRLYGFGSNDTNAIAPGEERQIRTPVLMAENIVSAAAGCCYSICLDRDGYILLFGHSSTPYAKCFRLPGYEFSEVFADPSNNIFWLRMENGCLLSFGYNLWENIAPRKDEIEYTFPEISVKVHYSGTFSQHYEEYGTQGYRACGSYGSYYHSDRGSILNSQVLKLKNTPQYRTAAARWQDCNLDLRFRPLPEKTRTLKKDKKVNTIRQSHSYVDETHVEKDQEEFFVPEIHALNHYIFAPVPVPEGKFHDPTRFLRGSGLVESTKTFSGEAYQNYGSDRLLDTDQKVCFAGDSKSCILTQDHVLYLEDKCILNPVTLEPHGRKRILDGVLDCSAADGTVYLLREDGRIFQTTTDDLWNDRSWDDFRKIPLP